MRILNTIVCLLFSILTFAQTEVLYRVLVLNEGRYDFQTYEIITPVTIGSYSPITKEYSYVSTVENARFASDIKIANNAYYVAADKFLLKYDLLTNELLAQQTLPGIRKIAVSEDKVIATRGEYLTNYDSYVQVYDANTLAPLYQFEISSGIDVASEGVIVKDNKAYIAINNGFDFGNEVGKIAVLDLENYQVENIYDLGVDGKNPENLMIKDNVIYTLNNKNFTGSSISSFDINTGNIITTNLANVSYGCGTSVLYENTIKYQELGSSIINTFDLATNTTIGGNDFTQPVYGIAIEPISKNIYGSRTDFLTYGKGYIFQPDGIVIDSFNTGISPGYFAFDVRASVSTFTPDVLKATIYPNPTNGALAILSDELIKNVQIKDILGNVLLQTDTTLQLNVSLLPKGMYYAQITSVNNKKSIQKIIIQ